MEQPPGWMLRTIGFIDRIGDWSGRVFCWLVIPLVLALTYEVIARYLFNAPTVWAYDIAYMLYGSHFMLGAAYTLWRKGHIRTDFFYEHWSVRRQGTIDACAYLFLFFPGMFFFFLASYDAAAHSWYIREASDASPWRPIIYPFKTVMPVTAALVFVQGVSEFLKSLWAARTGKWL